MYVGHGELRNRRLPEEDRAPLVTQLQIMCIEPRLTYCRKSTNGVPALRSCGQRDLFHRATPYDVATHPRVTYGTIVGEPNPAQPCAYFNIL